MKWTHGLSCSIPSSTGHKCTSKNMEDGPDEPTETTTFTSSTNCVGLHCHGEGSYLVTEGFGCWNSTWDVAGTTTGFYCRSYSLFNMFRAPLCPSSGAQEYCRVVAACGISCCGFQVAGLVWSWGLCVRFAGCCSKQHPANWNSLMMIIY